MRIVIMSSLACLMLSFAACGSDDDEADEAGEEGATGSVCPSNSSLTYASFGKGFMEAYCTRCHSSKLTGAARQLAPADHDFDSLAGIVDAIDHIDETTASGPDATNEAMPLGAPAPSRAERQKLGEWLACGAPP